MIDDKKIETAAVKSTNYLKGICDFTVINASEEGFKAGAKWAINEFIKYLWHPASEKPKRKAPLLCHRERKFLSFMVDELSDFEDWDTYIYDFDITEWLYLDDLFPKKGGEG